MVTCTETRLRVQGGFCDGHRGHGDADCHTSSPQSPPCSPPPEGQRRSNAPLWLLSPQRVPLCGAPLHWLAMTCRNLLRVSGCRNTVRNDMQKPETFLRVQGRPPPLVIARSVATWQFRNPCGRAWQRAAPKANAEKCHEFARSSANLSGFSAGTRIATPVCALVRNDMQKFAACQRLQEHGSQ